MLIFNFNISVTPRSFRHEVKKVNVPTGQKAPTECGTPTLVPVNILVELLVPFEQLRTCSNVLFRTPNFTSYSPVLMACQERSAMNLGFHYGKLVLISKSCYE